MVQKLEFTEDAIVLMNKACAFSVSQSKEDLVPLDLFLCIIHYHKDVVLSLLGRNINLSSNIVEKIENANVKQYNATSCNVSTELWELLNDDSASSPIIHWRQLFFARKLDVYVITYAILYNIDSDIADFLCENNFPNDENLISEIVQKNFFTGEYIKRPLKKYQKDIAVTLNSTAQSINDYISKNMPEQKDLADIFTNGLFDFWSKGNKGRAYTILLVSKSNSKLKDFIDTLNRAFDIENLQYSTVASYDLSNLSGSSQTDASILLGDVQSYRNSASGMLYELSEKSPLGLIALEHLERCHPNAIRIIKSYLDSEAVDAYHKKRIYIPRNIVILTLKIEEDTYEFITDTSADAQLQEDALFNALKQSDKEEFLKSLKLLNNSINKVLFLPDSKDEQLVDFINEKISEFTSDANASLVCDREKFAKVILQTFPKTPSLDELEFAIKRLFAKVSSRLNFKQLIINIADFPEYRLDEVIRRSRQEYLLWDFESKTLDDSLVFDFTNLRYKRLRHKKEIKVSQVYFKDVVGWSNQINKIRYSMDYVCNPKKYEDSPKPPCCFLLNGPPGVGKTFIVQAVATELGDCPVFECTASSAMNVYALEKIFKQAQKTAPSLIIIDEIDKMDDSQRNALLRILDGAKKLDKVLVFATTNHPESLDEALLRNGRFFSMHFNLPDEEQREAFITKYLKRWKTILKEEEIESFVEMTENMNIANIEGSLNTSLNYARFNNVDLNIDILESNMSDFKPASRNKPHIGF